MQTSQHTGRIKKGWKDLKFPERFETIKFDRGRTNPHLKFWQQACLPSLLFRSELLTLTDNLFLKLERCRLWFLKNIFHVPPFAHRRGGCNSFHLRPCSVKSVEYLKRLLNSLSSSLVALERDIYKLTKGCLMSEKMEPK